MKKLGGLAIALVVIAALLPASAAASQMETRVDLEIYGLIDSNGSVTYRFSGDALPEGLFGPKDHSGLEQLSGQSEVAALKCALTRREVELFRDEPEAADTLVGSTRTLFVGFFDGLVELPAEHVPGATYYAQVVEKVLTPKHHHKPKTTCLAGTSPAITVQPPQFGAAGQE